jgi:hypothetical protein
MTKETFLQPLAGTAVDFQAEDFEDEFETAADHHRMAAQHFSAAAKYHLLAATADDSGDEEANVRHAYLAYQHQLNAVQHAEIAALEREMMDPEFEDGTVIG